MADKEKQSAVPVTNKAKSAANSSSAQGTKDLSSKKQFIKKDPNSKPRRSFGDKAKSGETTESKDGAKRQRRGSKSGSSKRNSERVVSEFEERVLHIARVTTVVKGGRRFSFSAYVVIGNKKGKVGFGHGKANEVPDAIKKAVRNAQTNLIEVPIINKHTIPHDATGKFLSSRVLLKPAPKGKGMIASGTVRTVAELAGYSDIYSKTYGSRTPMNTAKATLVALQKMRTVEQIAELRDVSVESLKAKVA